MHIPAAWNVGRWAGVAEPAPDARRVGSAVIAAFLMAGLTVAGEDPESLGPGFGRLFLVFAIIAGPAVAALLVLRPWTGVIAWAATMPLLDVPRLQLWFGPVQITQTTIFIAALAVGVLLDRLGSTDRAAWPRAASIAAGALIVLPVLSLVAAPDVATGIPIVLHGVVEPVLVALLVVAARPTVRGLAALGGALVVGVTLASAYSIFRAGRVATSLAELEATRVSFAHFTYYNVGIFGDALAMVIPIAIAGLFVRRPLGLGRWATIALVAMLLVLMGALYLTFSKSAWLGTLVAVWLVLATRFQRPRQIVALVAGAAVVLALIVPYPLYIRSALNIDLGSTSILPLMSGSRLSSWDVGSPEGEVSIGERVRATVAAAKMSRDHPLLGVGPGRFGVEYDGAYADPNATRHLQSPHDFLPEVAAELGIPALLVVVGALMAALWWAWRAVRSGDVLLRSVGGAYLSALVAFLVVATTFGLDLYRPYRVMNADVITAGLIVGACGALAAAVRSKRAGAGQNGGG